MVIFSLLFSLLFLLAEQNETQQQQQQQQFQTQQSYLWQMSRVAGTSADDRLNMMGCFVAPAQQQQPQQAQPQQAQSQQPQQQQPQQQSHPILGTNQFIPTNYGQFVAAAAVDSNMTVSSIPAAQTTQPPATIFSPSFNPNQTISGGIAPGPIGPNPTTITTATITIPQSIAVTATATDDQQSHLMQQNETN